ncbi:MAG: hypothetical protein MUC50_05715 [Myxococcota bacterium]|nr:hypothetical protein [Myxococcota bacterium]
MPSNESSPPKEDTGRRDFLGRSALCIAATVGIGFVAAVPRPEAGQPGPVRTANCQACTGCAATCPKTAIAVTPDGPVIDRKLCVRCGVCTALCSVGGMTFSPRAQK